MKLRVHFQENIWNNFNLTFKAALQSIIFIIQLSLVQFDSIVI